MQTNKAALYVLGPNGCMRRKKEPKMSDIPGQGQALHTLFSFLLSSGPWSLWSGKQITIHRPLLKSGEV